MKREKCVAVNKSKRGRRSKEHFEIGIETQSSELLLLAFDPIFPH